MRTIFRHLKVQVVLLLVLFCSLQMNAQTTITSWVGNTWGKTTADPNWVQNDIRGMYVVPDGTVYTASCWDEGGRECGIYSTNGTFLNALDDTHARTWYCVAVGNNYVFVGYDNGFQRYTYNGNSKDGAYVQVSTNTIDDAAVHGLAINPAASELYVNNWKDGKIEVYNTSTLAKKRSWSFANGNQMAFDGTYLWAVQNTNIVKMNSTGTVLSTISSVNKPNGLWCDNFGSGGTARLLVTDLGPDQQIKVFSISGTPTQTGTFGDRYGITSGTPGQCSPTKLDGPQAVATDSSGNIYVACGNQYPSGYDGLVLRKYNSSFSMQWQREGLLFVNVATSDANDGSKIYTPYHIYSMDYSKNGNGQEWTHVSSTINSVAYPNDARLVPGATAAKALVRTISGNKYLYISFFQYDLFAIYKIDGQITKPVCVRSDNESSQYFPNAPTTIGYWYWQDTDGDGQMDANEYTQYDASDNTISWMFSEPDSNGNLWKVTWDTRKIQYIPLNSVNSYGVPIYALTPTAVTYTGTLAGNVTRLRAEGSDMYVAGNPANDFGHFQKLIKYTDWNGARNVAWTLNLNQDRISLDVAGDYVFLGYTDNNNMAIGGQIEIYNKTTGSLVTTLNAVNTNLGGAIGWFDFSNCANVVQRSNGEYTILAEDDGFSKSVLWRWCPTGNCSESTVAVTSVSVNPTSTSIALNATSQLTASVAPSNATNKSVTWSTSNSTVATVSSTGLVTGKVVGTATITVTTADGSKTATCAVTVTSGTWTTIENTNAGWAWSGFSLDACGSCSGGSSHSTGVTNSFGTISFIGTDIELYCENWTGAGSMEVFIDDVSKGTFVQSGLAKFATIVGLSNAQHTLKIVAKDANWPSLDYIRFYVAAATIPVTSVTMSPTTASIAVNATSQLTATVAPSNATNKNVTWSTSNSTVATVSSTGLVTGKLVGTATITVTTADGSKTATCAVTVTSGTWTTIENTNAGWAWSGFSLDACGSCSGGSSHSTGVTNSFGTISFTGTDIELHCENWTGAGSMEVFIDDVSKGTFVQSSLAKFATIGGLSNAQHTLKIVAKDANWPSLDYIRFIINTAKSAVSVSGIENTNASSTNIYPNPVSGVLYISNTEANADISIFSMDGKLVLKLKANGAEMEIDVAGWNKGIYILSINLNNQNMVTKLVVK